MNFTKIMRLMPLHLQSHVLLCGHWRFHRMPQFLFINCHIERLCGEAPMFATWCLYDEPLDIFLIPGYAAHDGYPDTAFRLILQKEIVADTY